LKNVLVVGSSNTDMVLRVPWIPRPGETVLGGEFAMAPGGKGANQAVAAARAGGHVTFIARVGADVFGERALDDSLLKLITILTPNEHEAEFLTGLPVKDEPGARRAAGRLRERGAAKAVITLGERGAYASSAEFEGLVPAFKVDPVDATAAGDVFNGALAVALAEKEPMKESLRFASAAAALSVTRPGAQPSAPTRAEIGAFLRSNTESIAP
jgi:sugar/nucleoside kinase (ribokinase family)